MNVEDGEKCYEKKNNDYSNFDNISDNKLFD